MEIRTQETESNSTHTGFNNDETPAIRWAVWVTVMSWGELLSSQARTAVSDPLALADTRLKSLFEGERDPRPL